jgi:hypothetical protein
MDDQKHGGLNSGANLFADYASVADSLGVYSTSDYAAIVDHLVARWGVADLRVRARRAACWPGCWLAGLLLGEAGCCLGRRAAPRAGPALAPRAPPSPPPRPFPRLPAAQVSGEAAAAQDFLCRHSERVRRLAELQMERRLRDRKRGRGRSASFSWVHGREVSLV